MLLSELQYAQTAKSKDYVLTTEEACKVVKAYHKKLNKSLKDYPEGDQKKQIEQEISLVSQYLPKAPTKEEVEAVVEKILKNAEEKNFGKLMKQALNDLGSFADAKILSEVIKEKLQK